MNPLIGANSKWKLIETIVTCKQWDELWLPWSTLGSQASILFTLDYDFEEGLFVDHSYTDP